jgi:hypothetical protein
VNDVADRDSQKRFRFVDVGAELAASAGGGVVEQIAVVASPGARGEGAVDLQILDDVRPLLDDPCPAGFLTVEGGLPQFGGVVQPADGCNATRRRLEAQLNLINQH